MLTIAEAVGACSLFDGLPQRYLDLIAGCARFSRFHADAAIFLEGQQADRFFLLREGRVSLEVFSPERGRLVVQTLGPGDALGWSWLFPPYRWHLDAIAREPVAAVAFDGACLRGKCRVDRARARADGTVRRADAAAVEGHAAPAPQRIRPWQPLSRAS